MHFVIAFLLAFALPTQDSGREPYSQGVKKVDSLIKKSADYSEAPDVREQAAKEATRIASDIEDKKMLFRAKVNELIQESRSYDFTKAHKLLAECDELAEEVDDNEFLVKLCLYRTFLDDDDSVKAIKYLRKAESLINNDPKQATIVQNFLGIRLTRVGAYSEALVSFQKAQEFAAAAHYTALDNNIKANIAFVFLKIEDLDQAEEIYQSMMPVTPDQMVYVVVQSKLAYIALKRERFQLARDTAFQALEKYDRRFVNKSQLGFANLVVSESYLGEGDFDNANLYLEKARELIKPDEYEAKRASIVQAKLFARTGQKDEAIEILEGLVEDDEPVMAIRAAEELVKIHMAAKDYEAAVEPLRLKFSLSEAYKRKTIKLTYDLAELKYRPLIELQESKAQAEAARTRAAQAELAAETSKLKSKNDRMVRNMAVAASVVAILGFLIYFRSELKRRETQSKLIESQRCADLEKRLAQKKRIEAIGQLTGNVAHDFNNLLQVLLQTNYLLKTLSKDRLNSQQEQLFNTSEQTVELGKKITGQLLAFARQQPVEPQETLIKDLLEQSKHLFDSVGGDECPLLVKIVDPGLAINVDRAQLSNAIINLLLNAHEAVGGHGKIELTVSGARINNVEATDWKAEPGDYVRIDVQDHGIGIDPENLERVFEPFFSSKNKTGSGLGLSSVLGFVQQSGGGIRIASELNQGTTVSMIFPRISVHEPRRMESSSYSDVELKGMKCLIVEDNEIVRQGICVILETMDIEVVTTESADEAIGRLEKGESYDFVISDIRMPGTMDGVELAKHISVHYPDIRVVLVSGNAAPDVEIRNCSFIRKPFGVSKLRSTLSASLSRTYS